MKAPHQVIYTHGGGRLGNQILRLVHWAAWALEFSGEVEVMNVAFWPYASAFARWQKYRACVFPFRPSRADGLAEMYTRLPAAIQRRLASRDRWPRFVHASGALWGAQTVRLDIAAGESLKLDATFLERVREARVTLCSGWKIANWELVAKHMEALRELLVPTEERHARSQRFMADLRRSSDHVVGVFIRQTDYQVWQDGRFFFPVSAYCDWMREVLALYPERNTVFLIASETRHDPAQFAGIPAVFASGTPNVGGDWMQTWIELAQCDCILTPPSTFSATAAFAGQVPLWPLLAGEQRMDSTPRLRGNLLDAAEHPIFSLSVK